MMYRKYTSIRRALHCKIAAELHWSWHIFKPTSIEATDQHSPAEHRDALRMMNKVNTYCQYKYPGTHYNLA